jgi:hypothetical protein
MARLLVVVGKVLAQVTVKADGSLLARPPEHLNPASSWCPSIVERHLPPSRTTIVVAVAFESDERYVVVQA